MTMADNNVKQWTDTSRVETADLQRWEDGVNKADCLEKQIPEMIEAHNTADGTHEDIRLMANEAKTIAMGKANSLVFDTKEQLDSWVAGTYTRSDGKTTADLKVGDNLYIVELGVPDYWWDGNTAKPIETEGMVGKKTSSGGEIFNDYANNKATSSFSHAEGRNTSATGFSSHAEGWDTIASGDGSHAEGLECKATQRASHAEGVGTIAGLLCQHVEGQYNIKNSDRYVHIIGDGASDTDRSNCHTVTIDGEAWYAKDVYVGSTSGKNKDSGSKKLATEEYVNSKISDKIDQTYSATSENAQSGIAVSQAISSKVDKIEGKGLSTNDFTEEYKSKLDGIESGAKVNVQSDWNQEDTSADDYIKNKPVVDQNYDPTSSNAQSGIAIASVIGDIETALDSIIAMQNSYIGGNG